MVKAKKEDYFYISPLIFDIVNLIFINFVFFMFYRLATSDTFLPLVIRVFIGTPIVLSSFYLEVESHNVFKKSHFKPEEIRNLITGGIYSKLRHPVYLGRILLNMGFLIMFPIMQMLFVTIVFILIWLLVAKYEEIILIKKFGKKYKSYKKKVPMFIPKKSTS